MVPASNSPVIDQGTADAQNDLTEDQRGLTRPVVFSGLIKPFDGADIGAVEVQQACSGFTQPTPSTACPQPPGPTPTQPVTPTPTPAAPKKKKCKKGFVKKKVKGKRKCVKKKGKK
jgi:hypothetical protein